MRRWQQDPLWRAVRMLEVSPRAAVLAVLAGVGGLGSAIALAAVAAWMIARAAEMPPVMALGIAAVGVRAFGVSRGLLRYLERLLSHDVALRGMATLRVRLYERLAGGSPASLVMLRRGDLLARVGADVDTIGDVLVRGLLPIAVAAVLGLGSVALLAAFLPTAGLALALCLVLAGVVAPWWSLRASRTVEVHSAQARSDLAAAAMTLLDGAAELTVAGRVDASLAAIREADRRLAVAADTGARPAAVAAAIAPFATGAAVLASLVLGIPATAAGVLAPVELAVIVLTPLAVFEATGLLPAAVVAVLRSREAARRVIDLLDATAPDSSGPGLNPSGRGQNASGPGQNASGGERAGATERPTAELLRARSLTCGWPDGPALVRDVDLGLTPGSSVVLVGPSGLGKTTLLLTLAGLLPPLAGTVSVPGLVGDGGAVQPVHTLSRSEAAARVALTPEDAHVFDTSVLENLRVARGDVTEAEARAALASVGLGEWLDALPSGLDTVLGADAARVSGGERRRLLLARALLSPAPVLLLDEPTEHLDTGAGPLLRTLLDGSLTPGRAVVVVTHRLAGVEAADEVVVLARDGSVAARGSHAELLGAAHEIHGTGTRAEPASIMGSEALDAYRAAWHAHQQEVR